MRRWVRRIVKAALVLVLVPVLLLGGVLVFANIGPGRLLIETLVARFTGGDVVVSGLSGRFPDRLRIARLALHDPRGDWLVAEQVAIDLSPLRLLAGELQVDDVRVAGALVARTPVASGKTGGGSSSLPVRIVVRRFDVARLELGAALAGKPAALAATGSVTLESLDDIHGRAELRPLGGEGRYTATAAAGPHSFDVQARLDEPAGGLLAGLAGLPSLGPLAAAVRLQGPWNAIASHLVASAGPLRAAADGTLDLRGEAADLTLSATAPAMAPRPYLSWTAVSVDARLHGRFAAPDATGTVRVDGLAAAGARIGRLSADLAGNAGLITLDASAETLTVPGPKPDLLAAAPLVLHAEARLNAPQLPLRFTLRHPLLDAAGTARTAGALSLDAQVKLPDLAPLAAAFGVALAGGADLAVQAGLADGVTTLAVDGTLGVTGGLAPVPALVGRQATLGLTARLGGGDLALTRFALDGQAIAAKASGRLGADGLAADFAVTLPDLAALSPALSGSLNAKGTARGAPADLTLDAEANGTVAAAGQSSGMLTATLHASGLPSAPSGRLTARGELEGAKLALAVNADRGPNGALRATIEAADWRSAHAEGAVTLAAGAALPQGQMALRVARLEDFRRLLNQDIAGALTAVASVAPRDGRPVATAAVALTGLRIAGVAGEVKLDATGPPEALELRLAAGLSTSALGDTRIAAEARLDAPQSQLRLAALTADTRGERVRLLAPATIDFAGGLAVDRLRLGLRQTVVDVAGRLSPELGLTASVTTSAADLAPLLGPGLKLVGTMKAEAKLSGKPGQPAGTVTLAVNGVRATSGPAQTLPPATLAATATLAAGRARIDARLAAGPALDLTVTGQVPLGATGAIALAARGGANLALLNPVLSPAGRRVKGRVTLDGTAAGTLARPALAGTLALANGDFEDAVLGAHLSAISGLLRADGDTVRIERFSAAAGSGTITASGSVQPLAAGLPVDLTVTARNARPLSGDQLVARLDADLYLRGALTGGATAGGTIKLLQADIRVPEKLPASVAVLPNVRVAGVKPLPPPPPPPDIALDLTLSAPGTITVKGRGLDAVLAGEVKLAGTAAAPRPSGSFTLVRGSFSIAGITLPFTTGTVSFGGGTTLDPPLDFVASRSSGSITASLVVGGTASAPKISFRSVPDLPQDEILSRLLFNQSAVNLNPFQLAQIAAVLAEVSGVGGGFDPFGALRSDFGLDRLSVEGGGAGRAAQVQAGRYVAPGVYVGAKQAVQGSGSQATVQIDIAKGVKLEADVGTGLQSATGAASSGAGGSVGVTWGFEY